MLITVIPLNKITPYARNPRQNAGAPVAKVKASLKEFGWRQPIVVDRDMVIVVGHTRYAAALELGMTEVPVVLFSDLAKSAQRNGVKDCFCEDCGIEFYARKDTSPVVCKRCGSARGGKVSGPIRYVSSHPCKTCNTPISDSLPDTYCSIECRKKDKYINRSCKYCGKTFQVYKSVLSSGTNSSGNFCSRQCYEQWLCNTERVKNYGVSWKKRREFIIKKFPFCAICGTTKRLQVHHIIPYRITFDNREENLIPLCVKHHKVIETTTHDIEIVENDYNQMLFILNNILRTQQQSTMMVIRDLIRAKS